MLIPTDDKSFARDQKTGALVNTDNESFTIYKARRAAASRRAEVELQVSALSEKVNSLDEKMDHIIKLLGNLA